MPAPVLRTSRLVLVPAVAEDLPALYRHWNTRAVRRFLWDDAPVETGTIQRVVATSERDFARAGYGIWTVRHTVEGPVIGTCGLRETAAGEVELLFSLDPAKWGLGLATEAARAVLDHLRSADPVVAFTDAGNVASQRVLARLGMAPCDPGDLPARTRWRTGPTPPASTRITPGDQE
ncbi:MAG: GNAT family N-acetyltransferase [Pseudonocardiaceae bacterium]